MRYLERHGLYRVFIIFLTLIYYADWVCIPSVIDAFTHTLLSYIGFDFGPNYQYVWYMLPAIIGRAAANAVGSNLNSSSRSPFYPVT